ncbi:unnamed protein product [Dicrocoelium dendriticum]|nr:unnamed protein product [Dicrocoelium dendriticum]
MQTYSCLLVLFGQILSISYLRADLMDLVSEAQCAARCFNLFTNSLTGQDRLFLEQRPDLTQPHCINQKGTCALCLEVCQWQRIQTTRCSESCQVALGTLPRTITAEDAESTCLDACQFAEETYSRAEQFSRGQLPLKCPRLESWPPTCQQRCKTEVDCSPMGLYKCCSSSACSKRDMPDGNATEKSVCTPAVTVSNGTPFITDRPAVKQTQVNSPETQPDTIPIDPQEPQYQLELDWSNYYNRTGNNPSGWDRSQYPAVFLVQLRQFHDPTASVRFTQSAEILAAADTFFDQWRNLVWTTKLGAVLSDLRPGTWYQFRLLTISKDGFGGWSEPSRPVRVLTRPVPPSSPRNLSEVRTRLFDHTVDVTIQWQPPRTGNLPLKKYQVTWRRYYGFSGDDKNSFTEYEASVPGDKTFYTIQNLQAAASYKIEVKAVSVFDAAEYSSHPISLFINTLPIPARSASLASSNHAVSTNESCRCDRMERPPIRIGEVFFENQRLKAPLHFKRMDAVLHRSSQYIVEWAPRVCIETQVFSSHPAYTLQRQMISGDELANFELDNLHFQCHYKVTLADLTSSPTEARTHKQWVACFCTPSCHTVPVRSGLPPANCTNAMVFGRLKSMRVSYEILTSMKAPLEMGIIQHPPVSSAELPQIYSPTESPPTGSTGSKAGTYDAVVKWYPVSESSAEGKRHYRTLFSRETDATDGVRGTRITWGPRIYEPVKLESYHNGLLPLLDLEKTQSKVLHPDTKDFVLKGLVLDTVYIVHVQMIGDRMEGPTTTIFLKYPASMEHTNAATTQLCRLNRSGWRMILGIPLYLLLLLEFTMR